MDNPVEKTKDGVYIQEEWQRVPPTGIVLGTGAGVTFVKKGDRVFFERYSAIDTPFGPDIKACRQEAILVKYTK